MTTLIQQTQDRMAGKTPAPSVDSTQQTVQPDTQIQAPQVEMPRASFRQRTFDRLQTEGVGTPPAAEMPPVDDTEIVQDDDLDARQTDDSVEDDPEALAQDTGEQVQDDDVSEGEEVDQTDDSYVAELQTRVEELETSNAELERGFRQRTHRLGESHRRIEESMIDVETSAQFYSNLAEQAVKQYDNVNFEALRAQPEEYRRMSEGYRQALATRDQLNQTLTTLQEQNRQRREEILKQKASISRDALTVEVPGWSRERHLQLVEYAVDKTGLYTEAEMSEMTDWRVLKLLDVVEKSSKMPKDLKGLKVKGKGKKAPVQRHAQRKQQLTPKRDALGRFQSTRQALRDDPGNRNLKRQMFRDKLAAEREAGKA